MTAVTNHVASKPHPDFAKIERLQALEARGVLQFVRQVPPDRATKRPRLYVVDYGRGEVEIPAANLDGWLDGFEAGMSAERADVPLATQLEDMEQKPLRELLRAVNAELKRRRS